MSALSEELERSIALHKAQPFHYGVVTAMLEQRALDELRRLETELAQVRAQTIEECAKVCDAHDPEGDRRKKFGKLSRFPDEAIAEIQAEERGEHIAAEIIARRIRALAKP